MPGIVPLDAVTLPEEEDEKDDDKSSVFEKKPKTAPPSNDKGDPYIWEEEE